MKTTSLVLPAPLPVLQPAYKRGDLVASATHAGNVYLVTDVFPDSMRVVVVASAEDNSYALGRPIDHVCPGNLKPFYGTISLTSS